MQENNTNNLSESFDINPTQRCFDWLSLSIDEKAFVVAYVNNAYSLGIAAQETGLSKDYCRSLLNIPKIDAAIAELQKESAEIEWLNEKWVKAQLVKLYPKVIGEEEVPFVSSRGEEMNVARFNPEIAMKILEYVAPKRNKPIEVDLKINVADEMEKLERLAKSVATNTSIEIRHEGNSVLTQNDSAS